MIDIDTILSQSWDREKRLYDRAVLASLINSRFDAIRRECAEEYIKLIRGTVEGGPKCPEGGDLFDTYMDGVRDAVQAACAAITASRREQSVKIDNVRCTKCGGNDFHTFCKTCKELEDHDDAIRRECAEAIEELKNTCVMHFPTPYEEGVYDGYVNAIAAIMSVGKE